MIISVVQWLEFLATDPEVRARFPALPDYLRSSGLERGPLSLASTIVELLVRKLAASIGNTAAGIRHADHVAPSIRKSGH
jgi:hypothetical protein